jgi:hypothetical protein
LFAPSAPPRAAACRPPILRKGGIPPRPGHPAAARGRLQAGRPGRLAPEPPGVSDTMQFGWLGPSPRPPWPQHLGRGHLQTCHPRLPINLLNTMAQHRSKTLAIRSTGGGANALWNGRRGRGGAGGPGGGQRALVCSPVACLGRRCHCPARTHASAAQGGDMASLPALNEGQPVPQEPADASGHDVSVPLSLNPVAIAVPLPRLCNVAQPCPPPRRHLPCGN